MARGLAPGDIVLVGERTRRSSTFHVTCDEGPDLLVTVTARRRRDDAAIERLWGLVRRRPPAARGAGDRSPDLTVEPWPVAVAA